VAAVIDLLLLGFGVDVAVVLVMIAIAWIALRKD
jgi:hypothetical protein